MPLTKFKKTSLTLAMALTLGALSACSSVTSVNVKPRQEPAYNYTQSTGVLGCVGQYISRTNARPVDIYISNIPDHTIPVIESGFLTKNSVMMATTAIDRLNTDKVAVVGQGGANKDRRQVQILGAFSELNRTSRSHALNGNVLIPGGFEVELGGDQNFNHIALDLALSEDNRIIPGTSTSVSIQVNGKSGNTTLTYDDGDEFAAVAALGFTGQEGFHAAQRLLIETSIGVMMAKYFDVDIRHCLISHSRENPLPIRGEFDRPVFSGESDLGHVQNRGALTINNQYYNPIIGGYGRNDAYFDRQYTQGDYGRTEPEQYWRPNNIAGQPQMATQPTLQVIQGPYPYPWP